jgi:hypothetical protein
MSKRMYRTGLAIFVMAIFAAGCKHEPLVVTPVPVDTTGNNGGNNNGGNNGGGGGGTGGQVDACDPDSVYFENDILPILISNCAKSGCHDAASHEDGVILDSYEHVMNTADVDPFDLDGGKLYEAITEDDSDDRMPPPPNAPLTSEQIALIAKWIMQGALNISCDVNAGSCDTSNVTYSGTIAPILQLYCTGCHSGSLLSGGIDLSVYTGVAAVAMNGSLEGAITHAAGYTPMPFGGNQLPDCEISQIIAWIDDGAPNN